MNGEYVISNGDAFVTDFASKGYEYFDVYTPEIASTYGQVFWTNLGDYMLPDEIRTRFRNKAIAIVGYEHDQVHVTPRGKPGVNPENDVSIPFNWVYNHHYMLWMTGSNAEMQHVHVPKSDLLKDNNKYGYGYGHIFAFSHHNSREVNSTHVELWVPVEKGSKYSYANLPNSQFFSEANGGESRKSFHGYGNKQAQILWNPSKWHVIPMQIDTRNRKCGIKLPQDILNSKECPYPKTNDGAKTDLKWYYPGPEPKQARYGLANPEYGFDLASISNYSGLLECPCTDRFGGDPVIYGKETLTKTLADSYTVVSSSKCTDGKANNALIETPYTCFRSAADMVSRMDYKFKVEKNLTISAADGTIGNQFPPGCSLDVKPNNGIQVTYNKFSKSKVKCANSDSASWEFYGQVDFPVTGVKAFLTIAKSSGLVKIRLSGPKDVWFGLAFNAHYMNDKPYSILVLPDQDTSTATVVEQKLGTCGDEASHCGGDRLQASVKVIQDKIETDPVTGKQIRTLQLERNLIGISKDHFSFITQDSQAVVNIPMMSAIGKSREFAHHSRHNKGILSLVSISDSTCLCIDGTSSNGGICDSKGQGCERFIQQCAKPCMGNFGQRCGSLVEQSNPVCVARSYSGGQKCCRGNGTILLDWHQDSPAQKELLRYHMKFRFYFQEYNDGSIPSSLQTTTLEAADKIRQRRTDIATTEISQLLRYNSDNGPSHYNLNRYYYQTEADASEYDVPPAFARRAKSKLGKEIVLPIPGYPGWPENKPTPGTSCTGRCPDGPDCECVHEIRARFHLPAKRNDGDSKGIRLLWANGHCHAPTCLDLELYRMDPGHEMELLCRQVAVYGQGNLTHDRFDDAGYIYIPPCLWSLPGEEKEGLQVGILLPAGAELLSVKRNRNTYFGHYGEMASWQMRGVEF
eukprot:CAMPEP_0204868148 /NCGR_PEP_ID=MMETSP1348-20121228/25541_1 /ASSEMBLY_ACC=CAM_ASM_000700 /TAXON_ID=215587 /ORGANISM="Aplanochytrium stocchinoi, Strain GSBS06" /LENGTH=914 /DNA_ID=CAMNT_0052020951 /DNA_START=597 /DNA_END=3341 /DNA_ORIENTATION=+